MFRDSCQFLTSSLEALVDNLRRDNTRPVLEPFKLLHGGFEEELERMAPDDAGRLERFEALFLRKGVFPYDWTNSFELLQSPELPSREDFYSRLRRSEVLYLFIVRVLTNIY